MMPEITVRDTKDNLTVLYHKGCQQSFKFFGDDPEEHKEYVKDEHCEMLKQMFSNYKDYPWEFLTRFYLHSRCLLFTDGVWMSETAAYPQFLRYKPGAHTSFRVSGITRFTALTNNCGAICVGVNPEEDKIPNLRRLVHKVENETHFLPMGGNSYLIPTEDCTYGNLEMGQGSINRAKLDMELIKFEQPGYLIEFVNQPLTLDEELIDYAHQWVSQRIEVFDRDVH